MISKAQQRRYEEIYRPAYAALMKFYPLTLDDLPGEQWREFDEHYHASNYGRVKSFCRKNVKILKPILVGQYLFINLHKNGVQKLFQIHRMIAELFLPNPDLKPKVNHIDGNKFNNYAGNLEWCTQAENNRHAVAMGLIKSGAEHHFAKLTNEQVEYVRENPDKLTTYKLAEKFSISQKAIVNIQTGKTYKIEGGTVRKPRKRKYTPPISDEIKKQIRAEYKKGVHGCGAPALAKKYCVDPKTISRIVKSAE